MKTTVIALLFSTLGAACNAPLLIDEYTNYPGTNAVGGYSSDDGTCNSTKPADHILSILPGTSKCYFYTNFPSSKPEDAIGGNRAVLEFNLTVPVNNWSFKINAKTWNGTNLSDSYSTVTGAKAGLQLLTIPLSSFNGPDIPNLRNIRSFVFESFSDNTKVWGLGKLVLPCAQTQTSTTAKTASVTESSTTKSSAKGTMTSVKKTSTEASTTKTSATTTTKKPTTAKTSSSAKKTTTSTKKSTTSARKTTTKVSTTKTTATTTKKLTTVKTTTSAKRTTTKATTTKTTATTTKKPTTVKTTTSAKKTTATTTKKPTTAKTTSSAKRTTTSVGAKMSTSGE